MKKTLLVTALSLCTLALSSTVSAQNHAHQHDNNLVIKVQLLDPANGNQDIGEVVVTESDYGLVFTPALNGLTPGLHGFHIHQNPSCEPQEKDGKIVAGLAAGGHWDPKETKQHGFPWQDDAHLGDLPALTVNADGTATNPVLAPRLKSLDEIQNRAIMIHAGGDNHSDHPAPLGGGGARMACGVIK
ncbi:superoxide dismutase family protein [Testudinibacter sp. TR-2022]|uniref:superoxide dismutase family protein n=1 Tax=Testudinibacter sp. TR-2022 TaxID=2585029 RepID=UPI00111A24CC|nr:superoxide dismutase family protein [Testudinibacter sp. TR-2022]TNH09444.1 superoxide dismutase family protein [Pasteurellaceae bacterium Phil11]TNH20963.1 superoxide dismutase family protein [Testudinibacter sp. TR-2022]TNH28410.1 superoxide dismutase family protein [Testudinibacter sp. TR-2022]